MALFDSKILGIAWTGTQLSVTGLNLQGDKQEVVMEVNKEVADEALLLEALKQVQAQAGVRDVQMVLPAKYAYHSFVSAPSDMDEEGFHSLVEEQMDRVFPLPSQELLYGTTAFKNVLPSGELLIFVGAYLREPLERWKALLEKAGWQRPVFVLEPWAYLAAYEPVPETLQKWIFIEKLGDRIVLSSFFYGVLVEVLESKDLAQDLPLLMAAYEEKLMTPVMHVAVSQSLLESVHPHLESTVQVHILKPKWDFSLALELDISKVASHGVALLPQQAKKDYYFLSKLI